MTRNRMLVLAIVAALVIAFILMKKPSETVSPTVAPSGEPAALGESGAVGASGSMGTSGGSGVSGISGASGTEGASGVGSSGATAPSNGSEGEAGSMQNGTSGSMQNGTSGSMQNGTPGSAQNGMPGSAQNSAAKSAGTARAKGASGAGTSETGLAPSEGTSETGETASTGAPRTGGTSSGKAIRPGTTAAGHAGVPAGPAAGENAGHVTGAGGAATGATAEISGAPGTKAAKNGKASGSKSANPEEQVARKAPAKKKEGGPLKPVPKPVSVAYGVAGPRVWLVASDLRDISSASTFEVGAPEGAKGTPWRNRAGAKYGDGVRLSSAGSATFLRDFSIHGGHRDVVAFCSPGVPGCLSKAPSQIKSGSDMSAPEHWLSGADKKGKSDTGGSSFTILFVAARGSQVPNPMLEHQNGEAYGRKGPFLGWIGTDVVGSVHGNQGVVSIAAIAAPNPYGGSPIPQIYTLRYNRAKEELRLFALGEKGASESKPLKLPKGDGPDNDQFAAYTIGSKTPGDGAVTYVFEHLAFPRALSNSELCKIHKEWNGKYALRIPSYSIEPCSNE